MCITGTLTPCKTLALFWISLTSLAATPSNTLTNHHYVALSDSHTEPPLAISRSLLKRYQLRIQADFDRVSSAERDISLCLRQPDSRVLNVSDELYRDFVTCVGCETASSLGPTPPFLDPSLTSWPPSRPTQ